MGWGGVMEARRRDWLGAQARYSDKQAANLCRQTP